MIERYILLSLWSMTPDSTSVAAETSTTVVANMLDINKIIDSVSQNELISDIHMSAEHYISYRINGEIVPQTDLGIVSAEFMELTLKHLTKSDSDRMAKFWAQKDMDFAYVAKSGLSYRVNAFMKLGKVAVVMRKINAQAKGLEELIYSDIADSIKKNVLGRKTGLFLVTWPTGSGKSTSLVAMLDYLNHQQNAHMITIEDPIEFIFKPDKCLISQREVGNDTRSFANALKSAMREDPNIIFVGEIRDLETAEAALNMAETGHLVFSTLHTSSASATINRYISLFPPEIQDSISDRLADSLSGVLSQFLVKTSDKKSRIWLYELMINTTSVRNNIRKREIKQIDNIIETSSAQGMISMKAYAQRLINQWLITEDNVARLLDSVVGQ